MEPDPDVLKCGRCSAVLPSLDEADRHQCGCGGRDCVGFLCEDDWELHGICRGELPRIPGFEKPAE